MTAVRGEKMEKLSLITDGQFNELLSEEVDNIQVNLKSQHLDGVEPIIITCQRAGLNLPIKKSILRFDALITQFEGNKYQLFMGAGNKWGHDEDPDSTTVAAFAVTEIRIHDGGEALLCFGMTIDNRINYAVLKIRRNKKGRIIRTKVFEYVPHNEHVSKNAHSDLLASFWRGYAGGKLKARYPAV